MDVTLLESRPAAAIWSASGSRTTRTTGPARAAKAATAARASRSGWVTSPRLPGRRSTSSSTSSRTSTGSRSRWTPARPAVLTTGGRTTLRGTVVQHVADDTVLVLRIGTGLSVVSVIGTRPPEPVLGREISFTVAHIALYPTDD